MKTKLFKTLAATAMSVLAIACAKEPVAVNGDGETSTVSFTVEVPETAVATKGISDASTTDELICQVFLNPSKDVYTPITELEQKVAVDVATHKAKVEFSLVKGNRYAFIFWAQASGTDYYDTSDLRSVKMKVDNVKANDPKMDAFWAAPTLTTTSSTIKDQNITLLRALAQVNFGAVLPALGRVDAVTVTTSKISMTGVPDTFHPFLGGKSTACEGSFDITFAENATIDEKLTVEGVDYSYLATAYVFAPKLDKKLTDAKATFTMSTGKTTSVSAPNVPIQGNYRTNILGDLLTVGATFNVKIDSEFKGGDKTYDAVSSSLEKGATVTLSNDYSVAKSTGVCIAVGVTSELNLNGKKFANENGATANKAALQVHGKLTINGDGEVYCEGGAVNNAIIVEQGGHLVINGGTYNVGKASSDKSNATIYVEGPDIYGRSGSVEIYGGTFKAEAGTDGTTSYVLNQKDAITTACFTVYGGTFIGFNPANVNEAHGAITSFVAPGYKSVKVSDTPETWEVQDATVSATTQEDFNNAAAQPNAVVSIPAGSFTAPASVADGVTIKGVDGTVIDIEDKVVSGYKNVTFQNVTVKTGTADYKGFQHATGVLTFESCTFTGKHFGYGEKEVYKNCTFKQDENDYSMWTYGANIDYIGCTFTGKGKFINVFNEGLEKKTINFDGCTFNNVGSENKPAINAKGTSTANGVVTNLAFEINIKNCSVTGPFPTVGTGNLTTNGGLWQVDDPVSDMAQNKVKVTVNGAVVYPAE